MEKAFPFLVKETPTEIAYHVVKAGEHLTFTEIGKPVQILGFYSTHDQGVFVHHGTNVHLHFMTEDRKTSGHIDALKLSGASTLYLPVPAPAQQKHADGVNQRGNLAMGLDHAKTTHHFRLLKDGGAVGIEANDEQDTASQDAIRQHLQRITKMFADGNFDLPMFIHATTPPGMETMKRLRKSILYRYSETPRGAEVRLSTHNPQALAAIQQFLRFQIQDHQTGDPLTVQNER